MYSFYSHSYSAPSGIFGFGIVFLLMLIIVITLKGLALWHASKRHDKWWFIAMLVINTAGILELVYLIFFAKIKWEQIFGEAKHDHPQHQK